MSIKDYLEKYIEGYLFGDLDNIVAKIPPGTTHGAASYPILASVLAGMESLGFFLMPDEDDFSDSGGDAYFCNYWDNYLAKEQPQYAGLAKVFRQLVRHGIAHTFLTKHGILVTRDEKIPELQVDQASGQLLLNADRFYDSFKRSYGKFVRPIVDAPSEGSAPIAERMQRKLDSFETAYHLKSQKLFGELQKTGPVAAPPLTLRPEGATGATGPTEPTITASGIENTTTTVTSSAPKTAIHTRPFDPDEK